MKRVLVLAFLSLASPALAADFSMVLTDQAGAPLRDELGAGAMTPGKICGDAGEKACLTLGLASQHALLFGFQDEQTLSGEEKFKRGKLALKLDRATDVALSAEDTALVKRLIAKLYGPMAVLRAWSLLDPAAN